MQRYHHSLSRTTVIALFGLVSALLAMVPGRAANLDSEEQAFVTLINNYRQQNGLQPLKVSDKIDAAAEWMSTDMAQKNYFSHTDSLGRDPFVRMAAFGYSYSTTKGENIAAGNSTAANTFTQWKNSPGHNSNMLNPNYRVMGIARAYSAGSTYRWYWTNDFGGYNDTGTTTPAPTPTPTPSDTVAPTVSISAPSYGTTISGTSTVRVAATDNVGVTKVVLQVSGGPTVTMTTAPYEYALDTTKLTNGYHTVKATAYDAAGHYASRSIYVTVKNSTTTPSPTPTPSDTTAPTISISAPIYGATISGTTTVRVAATDNVGVAKVVLQVSGGPTVTLTTAPYEYALDTKTLANGTHAITAMAYDAAGNSAGRRIYVIVKN